MSDRIPNFVVGDRVRVMQTRDMEVLGIANKRGTIYKLHGQEATIITSDHDEACVFLSSLAHDQRSILG